MEDLLIGPASFLFGHVVSVAMDLSCPTPIFMLMPSKGTDSCNQFLFDDTRRCEMY